MSDVSKSLRLLTKYEWCERFAQVAHKKWANEQIARIFERIARSLIFLKKMSDLLSKPMSEFPALVTGDPLLSSRQCPIVATVVACAQLWLNIHHYCTYRKILSVHKCWSRFLSENFVGGAWCGERESRRKSMARHFLLSVFPLSEVLEKSQGKGVKIIKKWSIFTKQTLFGRFINLVIFSSLVGFFYDK